MRHELGDDAQRNYPTYNLGHQEIALAEYEAAAERARDDDNAISIANGLLLAAIAPALPALSPFLNDFLQKPALPAELAANFAAFTAAVIFATAVASAYFCHLRRSYVFSARKVIVLRRMMGQSYGPTTLVLPNWRLEGADNPFSVRLFPGWAIQSCYPYYALAALISSISAYGASLSLPVLLMQTDLPLIVAGVRSSTLLIALLWTIWFAATLYFIRRNLFDHHESTFYVLTRIFARLLRVRLKNGAQTILYEARLARYEAHRISFDLSAAKRIAVAREDGRFYSHHGNDWRAMARSLLLRLQGISAGGGTTISQQLVRSLFVVDLHKTVRRKLIEILLARWIENLLTKNEILEIYLCAVRYDHGVYGILQAKRHFFGRTKHNPSQALVLVERISSVTGRFRAPAMLKTMSDMIAAGVVTRSDADLALKSYRKLISNGKAKEGGEGTPEDVSAALLLRFPAYK